MVQHLLDRVSVDRIGAHIRALEGVRHPLTTPQALEEAADYVLDGFQSLAYRVEPHVFTVEGREFRNIVATRPGLHQPDERVLVVAHYDTVEDSPGADDNASGVAVLLELARVLAPVALGRTVHLVAVNLEERQKEGPLEVAGLFGSRALAADARRQGWQIEGALVLEAVAYAGGDLVQHTPEGLPGALPEAGDFLGLVANERSRGLAEAFVQAVARHQIALPVVPLVVPGKGEMLPDTRRSDHAAFWDQGYPAVMLTDTANYRNPHYHQSSDRLETLNLSFAADVCRAVAATVLALAGVEAG
jgi:Zn-dependent M28 family amino/carboxypeptidase